MTLHPLNADSIRHRRAHRLALARARAWDDEHRNCRWPTWSVQARNRRASRRAT